MAIELFRLVGNIFVDNSEANKSIAKTDKKAGSVGKTLGKGIKTAAKWGAGLVAGTTAVATGAVALATKSTEAADKVDKMSEKIGISKKGYQEWSYVMQQNGMDISKMQVGMKTLVSQMDGVKNGTKSSIEHFKALGVSVVDSSGKMKSQENVMNSTLKALADMPNGAEKARLATQLFGKAGVEMLPMLNKGSKDMKNLKDRANELGLVMSDETVDAGVKLGDTMDDLKSSFGQIFVKLGANLFPVLQKIIDAIISNLPKIQSLFDGFAPTFSMLFSQVLPQLMNLAQQILPLIMNGISSLMPFIAQIISQIMPILIKLLSTLLPPLIQIINELLPVLMPIIQLALDLLSPLIDLLKPILDIILAIIKPIVKLIKIVLPPLIAIIKDRLMVAINGIKGVLNGVKTWLSGIIDFITGVFTGNWKKAWNGIKKIFSGIWDGIKSAFKIPINWIIQGINLFIKGINKIKIPDWVPVVGGKGFSIKQIPLLAKGGKTIQGNAIVGEAGPELLSVNGNKTKVTPLSGNDKKISGVGSSFNFTIENFINKTDKDIDTLVNTIYNKFSQKLSREGYSY